MNKSFSGALCVGVFTLGLAASADAALLSRLGGQAVYDTDLNITWLADANAGAGSAFDDGFNGSDGLMTWGSANAWADSLSIAGFNDWRLPTVDPACGFNSRNCVDGEMGHLFYDELGGTADSSIFSSGDPDLALFSNFPLFPHFWASNEASSRNAWYFVFSNGNQLFINKNSNIAAWAVRDGDVGVVSEPSILALLGIGLLGFMRRKGGNL